MADLYYDPYDFEIDTDPYPLWRRMRDAQPLSLSIALDLARAPGTSRAFESMARLASHLAVALEGRIVDDNGSALDERAIAAIAQQLDGVRAQMEARGLTPGGPAALRLFS